MQVCIQDPHNHATYFLGEQDLATFCVGPNNRGAEADVLLVCPSDTLVHELPASRMTDSDTPSVQIVDPAGNKSWLLHFAELQKFRVATPPRDADDVVWFAMPSAKDVLAAVPVFRRALVQHSS